MIGYEAGFTVSEERRQSKEDEIDARIEELTAEIESKPYEADDLYCGVERAEEKFLIEITVLINNGAYLKAAEKLEALMDAARSRRAEWQAEEQALEDFE